MERAPNEPEPTAEWAEHRCSICGELGHPDEACAHNLSWEHYVDEYGYA